jgi:hypothetical protein
MANTNYQSSWNRGAAIALLAGVIVSVAGAALVVVACPQPPWSDLQTFRSAYHPLQSFIFVPSVLLPLSFLAVLSGFHSQAKTEIKPWTFLASAMGGVGATILCVNYLIQGVWIPSLIRQDSDLVGMFASANPGSLFWTFELFGYAILGLAMWAAILIFQKSGLDRAIRWLIIANGAGSLGAALAAAVDSSWVLGPFGLGVVLMWNVLIVFLSILLIRRSRQVAR